MSEQAGEEIVEDDSLVTRIAYRRLDLHRDDFAAGFDTALECD